MHAGGADGFRKAVAYVLLFLLMVLWARAALAQDTAAQPEAVADRVAYVLDVQGPIGPATRDFVARSLETAAGARLPGALRRDPARGTWRLRCSLE